MDTSHRRLSENTPLTALVRRARWRHICQLLVDESALALCFFLGGVILLLILGTELLSWYWLVTLLAAGLSVGAWRMRKKLVSRYSLACTLDRNLGLDDALSTALYFDEHPANAKSPAGVVSQQNKMAQELARSADLKRGLPYSFSRPVYVSAGLALAVAGVFTLRFGVTRTIDLHSSLVALAYDSFLGSDARIAEARKKALDRRAKNWQNPASMKYDPWQAQPQDQTGAPEGELRTIDTPNVDNSDKTGPAADPKASGKESKQETDSSAENPDGSERSTGGNPQSADGSKSGSPEGNKAGSPPPGASQKGAGESSSLTDKMRDALSNLLSKFKSQPKNGGTKSGSQQGQTGGQQSAQNRQPNGQNGTPTPGKPDAMASPDGQGGQDAQGSEQAQAGQGKSAGKSDDHSSSQDGKSGVGRQDGDKSIREAEQLAAMGKISEIIGKRSQNISGEVMVEVGSGKQQLHTQYTQKKAGHSDSGGEINRDEVPLAYQQYVQQYFEEIRKLPATGAKSKGSKSSDTQKKSGPS